MRAVGCRQADGRAEALQYVTDNTRDRRFAIGAGNADHGYSSGRAVWIKHVDDRAADIAWLSFARKAVHAQAWAGVQLENAAVLYRSRNIFGDEIDAADVESRQASSALAHEFD
jgi:hypothetical protein